MSEVRHGMAQWSDGREKPQPIKVVLSEDTLSLQREEMVYTQADAEQMDHTLLSKVNERTVTVCREKIGGLGLSVKGGAEHNLPVLISRIFKEQAADRTGQLFVGDAIISVNGQNIEVSGHDTAVTTLKNAGDEVTLVVKYFKPASLFLNRNRRHDRDEENNQTLGDGILQEMDESKWEKQWTDLVSIPLICAFITRYMPGSDKTRQNAFEVVGMDGTSSGVIHCDDTQSLHDWIQCISHNITLLNNQSMSSINKLLLPAQQIIHMSWVNARQSPTRHWQTWKPQFIAMKGADLCIFESPPTKTRNWVHCDSTDKIYECMLRIPKESEYLDGRQHCITIQTGAGEHHYWSLESRQELLAFEKSWYRANYLAVKHLGSKTFGCTWRGRISGLTLDLNVGFSLYDSENKTYMWSYRFSQLKGSSDDGKSKLKLMFLNDVTQQVDSREVECTNLQTLLFSMHAFLSAKLASVDPSFLMNL